MSGAEPRWREREENAADLPKSQQTQAAQGPWIPGPHEDAGRAEGPCQPAAEGAPLPDGERRDPRQEPAVAAAERTARFVAGGRRFRFPKSARLRRGEDIRAILSAGSRRRCGLIEVYRGRSGSGRPRAGIVVPRYGRSIVERNRLKRRLRECVRTMWLPRAREQASAPDLLVRARPAAYEIDFPTLREAFARCVEAGR